MTQGKASVDISVDDFPGIHLEEDAPSWRSQRRANELLAELEFDSRISRCASFTDVGVICAPFAVSVATEKQTVPQRRTNAVTKADNL